MKTKSIISLLLIVPFLSSAQMAEVKLTPKHIKKLESITSMKDKLHRYRKYYHKDSLKQSRQLEKYWQLKSDSLFYAANSSSEKSKKKLVRLTSKMDKLKLPEGFRTKADELASKLPILNSEISNGSPDVPSLPEVPASIPGTDNATEKIKQLSGDTPSEIEQYSNIDSLKGQGIQAGKNYATKQMGQLDEFSDLTEVQGQIQKADQFKQSMMDQSSKNPLEKYDSASIKEEAKKKAEEMAMQYLNDNPEVLKNVQRQASLLMKKYSVVPNSNDLSSAIKRTSLKGRTFRERLVIGANFQILNLDPVSIDFSPTIGYKLNSRFLVGIGGTYRQQFSTDTIPHLSPDMMGYKVLTSYDIVNTYFLYSEYDRNTTGYNKTENSQNRIWNQSLLLGAGKRFAVHKKIDMTLVVAYDFLYNKTNSVYPRPWIVRVGFQTSELAMLKKRPAK